MLRLAAALAVVIWHYQHFSFDGNNFALVRNAQPFYDLLWPFYAHGLNGVWVFWCISGFIFFTKYRDAIVQQRISGGAFFVLRLSRLYPLHLATLLLVAAIQPVYQHLNGYFFVYQNNDLPHFLLQLYLASNWLHPSDFSFNGPIWSISIEVLVYLCFFLTLRWVGSSFAINVVIVILCIGVRIGFGELPIADCFAFFYLGGLAAIARSAFRQRLREVAIVATAAIFIAVLLLTVRTLDWPWTENLAYGIFMLATPVCLLALGGHWALGVRLQRVIEAAGNMTYASYLLHFPIQLLIAVVCAIRHTAIPFEAPEFLVLFIAGVLAASYASYRWFEKPAQDAMRDRLLPQSPAPTVIPA